MAKRSAPTVRSVCGFSRESAASRAQGEQMKNSFSRELPFQPFSAADFDPIKARDLIVEYFHEAQREKFFTARRALGASTGDREVYETVVGAVKMVFTTHGVDFANPTRDGLARVIEALARKASAWGLPCHAVERQRGHMRALLGHFDS